MPALTYLDISHNNLGGSIPENFGNNMPALTYLDISHNNLGGSIPENFGKGISVVIALANPGLRGFNEDMNKLIGIEFYASMEVGYVVGFLGLNVTMLFNRPFRFAYFKFLQDVVDWAYVVAAVHKAKFVRILGVNRWSRDGA
ncbi:unnamed protein product [Cuscuta europaea]|nr:unnamed protein product [Cuscuta europaea]